MGRVGAHPVTIVVQASNNHAQPHSSVVFHVILVSRVRMAFQQHAHAESIMSCIKPPRPAPVSSALLVELAMPPTSPAVFAQARAPMATCALLAALFRKSAQQAAIVMAHLSSRAQPVRFAQQTAAMLHIAWQAATVPPAAQCPLNALQAAIVMARLCSRAQPVRFAQETAPKVPSVRQAATVPPAAQHPQNAMSVHYAPPKAVPRYHAQRPLSYQFATLNATGVLHPAHLAQAVHYSCCQISGCPLVFRATSPVPRCSILAMGGATSPTLPPRPHHACRGTRVPLAAFAGLATCTHRGSAPSAAHAVRAGLCQP
jgi:hypothetical protein